jgi:[acyl-carrier-protein] S-malonyltransferase
VTAATTAGILNKYDALTFVTKRGTTMAHAAALTATGMSAVIGAQHGELLARLSELGLQPANFNGAGQVVVAGTRDALAKLRENPPTSSRVIPLHVAGAFHTHYMQPAVAELTKTAAQITPHDPQLTIWTNNNGSQVSSGKHFLKLLVNQVSSPVHWDACMRGFISAGVTGIIEITPAGTLTGLAKRTLKDIPIVAINTPDDLDAARELIDTGTPL